MGYLRYRRTVKLIPHLLHLHIAKTGVSVSVGRPPFTVNFGRRGTMVTTSIPGSGLSYRARLKRIDTDAIRRKQSRELTWVGLLAILVIFIGAFFFFALIWNLE